MILMGGRDGFVVLSRGCYLLANSAFAHA